MLTLRIREALKNGHRGVEFAWLISDYGKWSRGAFCKGYGGSVGPVDYSLDDESAMQVDQAMCELKAHQPRTFKLLFDYYVAGADLQDLDRRRRVRKNSPYRASLRDIEFQLGVGRRLLWEILNASNNLAE